jgi:ArsR family transcriptional regulator
MAEVKLAQSTVSEHVACLRDCGLITGRPQGREVFYSLACPEVLLLLEYAQRVLQATGYAVEDCPRYGHGKRGGQL